MKTKLSCETSTTNESCGCENKALVREVVLKEVQVEVVKMQFSLSFRHETGRSRGCYILPSLPYSSLLFSTLCYPTLLYSCLFCATLLYSAPALPCSILHFPALFYTSLLFYTLLCRSLLFSLFSSLLFSILPFLNLHNTISLQSFLWLPCTWLISTNFHPGFAAGIFSWCHEAHNTFLDSAQRLHRQPMLGLQGGNRPWFDFDPRSLTSFGTLFFFLLGVGISA